MTSRYHSPSSAGDGRAAGVVLAPARRWGPCLLAVLLLGLPALPAPKQAQRKAPKAPPAPTARPPSPAQPKPSVAPLPPGAKIVWAHAPYEDGDCSLCHERRSAKNPGRITMPVNELCFSCHPDSQHALQSRARSHEPARKRCTTCHNPHNSSVRKLLVKNVVDLCFDCHEAMKKDVRESAVGHLPVTEGDQCGNCHNPHAAEVDHLLRFLPYDLCVTCHGIDDVRDTRGVKLANIRETLARGPVKHGAVTDCTACHAAHGGKHFRLLVDAYPADFYAPYDPKNYALCFECHKPEMARDAQTTTLTRFRDGSRNLHYLHVNNGEKGRTCRACHEPHASHERHLLRDAVPFGTKGFLLEVNYESTPTGGRCDKTCHSAKTYSVQLAGQGKQTPP